MKTTRILAVDDHKMTVLGYKYILEDAVFDNIEIKMDIETNFEFAKQKIENSAKKNPYDLIMLDVQLFPTEAKDPRSGEDLGKLARELVPDTKIVYMSSFGDGYRINSIFRSVNPDGYMVKSEIDETTLCQMVKKIANGESYYTQSASIIMRKNMLHTFKVDDVNKKILYHLSIGASAKEICAAVAVAPSTLDGRKRQLKVAFDVSGKNDLALIEAAKNRGFI